MTELLRRAMARLEQLSEEEQDAIAARLLAMADDQRWETLLRHPKTEALLDMLSAEADAEDDAGQTRPLRESYE